jgi:electron transfer flavoprotein alpha subunit
MESVLVLVHAPVEKPALEAIEAARLLGAPFSLGVIGAGAEVPACGAQRSFAVPGAEFTVPRYATDAAAAEALVKAASATVVLAPGTSRMMRALPGVAARLNGKADSHVVSLSPGLDASRWFYRQRMEATFTRSARPWFLLLEPGAFQPAHPDAINTDFTTVNVPVPACRTRVTGTRSPQARQQTIRPDAAILFVAGAGWTKKQKDGQAHVDEAAALITGFLDSTKASLGSSKSLVDLSGEGQAVLPFLSHLNQIGQTGSTPRHPKGLATCCHGEEPHVVGWRFIQDRRAVNLDANCGWARGKADVLYVADAFEVMRCLNALLSS